MKPQHLMLMALAGLGLGGGLYWFSSRQGSGDKPGGQDKPGGSGKGSGAGTQGYDPKPDVVWNPPGKKWVVGGWDSDYEKWQAVLDYHNKTKEKIALAPGVSFDEQGNLQTNMPIIVANPYPVM